MKPPISIISVILTILSLTACTGGDEETIAMLDRAEALMEDNPDSAYTLLYNIDSLRMESDDAPSSLRARYYLLLGTAMNKTDRPMAFDSLFQHTVVDYYDRHGSRNDQMRARYILGSICRDMHDSPRAIEWYLSAADRADTLSSDCDYLTLMRIYGQMAEVYLRQQMAQDYIESQRKYSKYAAKCDNTYEYIRGIELQVSAYLQLKDTAGVFTITDSVYRLYIQNNMSREAASVYPTAIYIHLLNHNYAKAKRLMDIFELQSGLFDSNGEIEKGREHYYLSKAMYYHGTNKPDSAAYFYRKLIDFGYNLDGYRGLLGLSIDGYMRDSLAHYAQEYENQLANTVYEINIESMQNVKGMYDYSRNQRAAHTAELKAAKTRYTLYIIIIFAVVLLAILSLLTIARKRRKESEIRQLNEMLANVQAMLDHKKQEMEDLHRDHALFEQNHQKEIESLQHLLESTRSELQGKNAEVSTLIKQLEAGQKLVSGWKMYEDDSHVRNSNVFGKLKAMTVNPVNTIMTQADWQQLLDLCESSMPKLCSKMRSSGLSDIQSQVVLLVRLGFSNGDIVRITGKDKQNVRNHKSRACKRMFGTDSAESLYQLLIMFDGVESEK